MGNKVKYLTVPWRERKDRKENKAFRLKVSPLRNVFFSVEHKIYYRNMHGLIGFWIKIYFYTIRNLDIFELVS